MTTICTANTPFKMTVGEDFFTQAFSLFFTVFFSLSVDISFASSLSCQHTNTPLIITIMIRHNCKLNERSFFIFYSVKHQMSLIAFLLLANSSHNMVIMV